MSLLLISVSFAFVGRARTYNAHESIRAMLWDAGAGFVKINPLTYIVEDKRTAAEWSERLQTNSALAGVDARIVVAEVELGAVEALLPAGTCLWLRDCAKSFKAIPRPPERDEV